MLPLLPPSLVGVTLVDLDRGWRRHGDGQAPGEMVVRSDLESSPFVVLLGQPGYGKTSELYRWHLDTSGSTWIDLGDIGDHQSLLAGLDRPDVIFVDGCEEYSFAAAPLFRALADAQADGRIIRLACRSAWWAVHRDLATTRLQNIDVVELQPLSPAGAALLLRSSRFDDQIIIGMATSGGAGTLIQNPRFLLALAKAVDLTGEIPASRLEIYEMLANAGAIEHNPALRRANGRSSANVRAVAEWFAAASLLTRRAVFTEELAVPDDGRMPTSTVMNAAALEGLHGTIAAMDVLGSHLMTPAEEGFRFVDQSIAEFLAASLLASHVDGRPDSIRRWQMLLTTTIGGQSHVPPGLRGLAAWASEMSSEAFDVVFAADQSVLLENDFAQHPSAGAARLFQQLISNDELLGRARFTPAVLRAAFSAAEGGSVFEALLNAPGHAAERRRALEFIGSAGLRDFDDKIASIVVDSNEETWIRYWAATSLSPQTEPSALAQVVQQLVSGVLPGDPDHRILGMVLSAVWPTLLTAEAIFPLLQPPTSTGILDYEIFLSTKLVAGFSVEDTPLALAWVPTLLGERWNRSYLQERLASSIAELAANALHDEALHSDLRGRITAELPACVPGLLEEIRGSELDDLRSALRLPETIELIRQTVRLVADEKLDPYELVYTSMWLADYGEGAHLVRSVFEETCAANEEIRHLWLTAFRQLLRPERDRTVVDDVLELEGAARVVFSEFIDEREIAAVPRYIRRRREVAGDPVVSVSLDAVLLGDTTWQDYILSRLEVVTLGDSSVVSPGEHVAGTEEAEVLAAILTETLRAGPGEPSGDPHSVGLGELALAWAVESLYAVGRSTEVTSSTLAGYVQPLIRCGDFIPTATYRNVLNDLCTSAPEAVRSALVSRLQHSAHCPRCNGRAYWLHNYPDTMLAHLGSDVTAIVGDATHSHQTRSNLLADAAKLVAATSADSSQVLGSFGGTLSYGSAAMSLAAAGLPVLEVALQSPNEDDARSAISALGGLRGQSSYRELLTGMSFDQIGDLFERATGLFERSQIPASGAGVPVGWEVDRLREDCLQVLASDLGGGLDVLHRLCQQRPLASLLGRQTMQQLVDRAWTPLAPEQFVALMVDSSSSVVRNAAELLRVTIRGLEVYQESLKDVGGGAELLWESRCPREETDLSIDLARFLRQYFRGKNVLLNREVEMKPASASPEVHGERSDILIQAKTTNGDTLTLVVELKGSWNPSKYSGYQSQLVDRYLTHPSVDAGLHVVFWFDRVSWDPGSSRRSKSPNERKVVEQQLKAKKPSATKPLDHFVVDAGLSA